MSRLIVSARQSMLIAGLIQGFVMLGLHEWIKSKSFDLSNLVYIVPLYTLAVLGPLTFNFLRAEFSCRQSFIYATLISGVLALTGAWFGWNYVLPAETRLYQSPNFIAGLWVFGFVSAVIWFHILPFAQSRLRHSEPAFSYSGLFEDAWRNCLLLANCFVFSGIFWALLGLWAGLFEVLKIKFFSDLFTTRYFVYLATAMSVSFAVSLEDKEASALVTIRRYLLAVQARLLPLAAFIVLLFLVTLPFSGLHKLWDTGSATALMLGLQYAVIILTNAVWQDGKQPLPFSSFTRSFIRMALIALPVLSVLCVWALHLRVDQYGWTIDRIWAAILVAFISLYTAAYCAAAVRSGWLQSLGRLNTAIALFVIATLLAVHTPLLDPQRISASSQVSRLLAGKVAASNFDYEYLRFNLGRAGAQALRELEKIDHQAEAATIRSKATAALNLHSASTLDAWEHLPSQQEITARINLYPKGTALDLEFVAALHQRVTTEEYDHYTRALREDKEPIAVLAVDLNKDGTPEYIFLKDPYPVFSKQGKQWRLIGNMWFNNTDAMREKELEQATANADFAVVPRLWSDLRIGGSEGRLQLER
jgi:hypothetical protein